jgi:trk system potassium uptake protein TrkH
MLLFTTAVMVVAGQIDIINSLTISLSLISNVGAGLDTNIGPQMSWADLSIEMKWACSVLMLVGRLEIMTVLVLFTRSFWREN